MARRVMAALFVGLVLTAAPAWPLSDSDGGNAWNAAPFQQKIQVANILSRDLGIDPAKLQECLDKTFADPANIGKTIRVAAQECKEQRP